MRDQVDLQAVADAGHFDRLAAGVQAEHVAHRQHMDAAQIVVGVGRGEAVEVRPLIVANSSG